MAKSKKKGSPAGGMQKPLSPRRYFEERVAALPLGSCYLSPDYQGMRVAVITRRMANGNLAFAGFIVDTGCLGVKNALYAYNVTEETFREEYLDRLGAEFAEVPYAEVHNFILGAVEYAENLGIDPHPDFAIAQLIMEEDNDDIELIEYDYGGPDGRPMLMIGPDGAERKYIGLLDRRLGPGGYSVTGTLDPDDTELAISEEWILSGKYREDDSLDEDDIKYFDAFADLLRLGAVTFDGVIDAEDSEEALDDDVPDIVDILLDESARRHDEVLRDTADRSFLTSDRYTDADRIRLWIFTKELGTEPIDPAILADTIRISMQSAAEADDSTII